MRGLWLEERRLALREDLEPPAPAPGEVLVQVRLAGICNTDLELLRGYMPFAGVPGHEFVGVVAPGHGGLSGRRVVGEINASCRECDACRAGRSTHCPRRTVLGIAGRHGVFAEMTRLPEDCLHLVPDELPDEVAVFTEPLAAALEIQEQVEVRPRTRVLVIGDGKLGQLIARTLALTGCRLHVAGRHAAKLDLLRHAGIATLNGPGAVEAGAYDLVVVCAGRPEAFALAPRAVRPAGTLVLKSTNAGRLEVDASGLVVDEIRLVGSRCGPFAPALALMAAGRVDVTPLIAARYPLARGEEAFRRAATPGTLKVLLEMDASGD